MARRIFDKLKRPWDIEIDPYTVRHVKDRLKINLLELVEPESTLLNNLGADPILQVDVLFALCEEQAQKAGIADTDFSRQLDRDMIDEGLDAILEGVTDFSQRALRPAYRKVLEKARQHKQKQEKRVAEEVASPEFDQALEREIEKQLQVPSRPPESELIEPSNAAGSLPASSESVLGDLPSAT